MNFRIGNGYDIHALVEATPFVLGGVVLNWHKGSKGHSDGDALIHAICDALLGAAALGDIGTHFPDTDTENKGAESKIFLQKVLELLYLHQWKIANMDATILLEKPKLADYKNAIAQSLCKLMGLKQNQISIKAKTAEGFGAVGRQEAVVVWVSALIFKNN